MEDERELGGRVSDEAGEFPCDQCGAELVWSPKDGALACAYCGHREELELRSGGTFEVGEYSLKDAGSAVRGLGLVTRRVSCENCAAVVNLGDVSTAGTCVFCGSSAILDQAENRNLIRPESLIPLEIGREAVEVRFREWLGSRWFRPNALKRLKRFEAVGVYVPYWSFDAGVDSTWTAESGTYYWVTEHYTTRDSQGNQVTRTRQVRRTHWEPSSGARSDSYQDHWVHASAGISSSLADKLGSFDPSELVPYRSEYLAGWLAEEYSLDLEGGWNAGREALRRKQHRRCSGDVPGDTQRSLRVSNHFYDVRWKHVLLPIWSLSYRHGKKTYAVLVHGQTGRIAGHAPISWVKILLLVLLVATVVLGLVVLSSR